MFVACPHCGFLVAAQTGASLRCPRCASPIDSRLAQPLPTPAPEPVDANDAPETDPTPASEAPVVETAAGTASETPPARRKRGSLAPSFVRRHAPAPARTRQWRSWLVVAALGLVLSGQIVLAQREELAASARWRPLIGGVCAVLGCQVPAWHEPTAFVMLQRSVQPKVGTPGVLHVSASFRNDARWAQPWPTVLLTLSDMDGRQVGQRAFAAAEYRGKGDAGHIAPGQSATIQIDVVEPAQQVVAFTFDFL